MPQRSYLDHHFNNAMDTGDIAEDSFMDDAECEENDVVEDDEEESIVVSGVEGNVVEDDEEECIVVGVEEGNVLEDNVENKNPSMLQFKMLFIFLKDSRDHSSSPFSSFSP